MRRVARDYFKYSFIGQWMIRVRLRLFQFKWIKLSIGNYVSISEDVTFLLDVEHYTDKISTYPFKVKLLHNCTFEAFSKGDIVV